MSLILTINLTHFSSKIRTYTNNSIIIYVLYMVFLSLNVRDTHVKE